MREIMKRVGAGIRSLREQKKLTQEKIAEAAHINPTYYGRIERGEANVSIELLTAIAETMNVQVASLLDVDLTLDDPERVKHEIIENLQNLTVEQLKIVASLLVVIREK
jgi:transcriptional regulator with XRE-family HTH domain